LRRLRCESYSAPLQSCQQPKHSFPRRQMQKKAHFL